MVTKIIADEIVGSTVASPNRHKRRDVALSSEQALVFAKNIAAHILSEIQVCGSLQTLSGLSAKLNRYRAILQVMELRREQNDLRIHG